MILVDPESFHPTPNEKWRLNSASSRSRCGVADQYVRINEVFSTKSQLLSKGVCFVHVLSDFLCISQSPDGPELVFSGPASLALTKTDATTMGRCRHADGKESTYLGLYVQLDVTSS